MKKPQAILAVLLCYVLTYSQAYAIRGGPPFGPGGGSGTVVVNTTGTYSGVLLGTTEIVGGDDGGDVPPPIPGDDPGDDGDGGGTPPDDGNGTSVSNALGLFDLVVTVGGVAQGTFLMFSQGRVFRGDINGVADPSTGAVQGVLEAQFNFNLQTLNNEGNLVSIPVAASIVGRLTATIFSPVFAAAAQTPGLTNAGSAQLVTLAGTARLDLNFGFVDGATLQPIIDRSINFTVSGFRNTLNDGSNFDGTVGAGG